MQLKSSSLSRRCNTCIFKCSDLLLLLFSTLAIVFFCKKLLFIVDITAMSEAMDSAVDDDSKSEQLSDGRFEYRAHRADT